MAQATKRLRAWFEEITATATKRGTRLRDGDRPTQATFADLRASTIFKTEGDDRAKEDNSLTAIEDLNGHVVAATDAQATSNQAKKDDRTLVVQPSQLPTTEASVEKAAFSVKNLDGNYDESYENYDDVLMSITKGGETSRNRYIANFYTGFIDYFNKFTLSFNDITTKVKTQFGTLNNHENRILTLESTVSPGGVLENFAPVGSQIFHVNPALAADAVWKPADGKTVVSKYVTPGDSGSGDALIYTMLKDIYNVVNDVDPDYFLLPNLSNAMIYQEIDDDDNYGLGFNKKSQTSPDLSDGKWEVSIDSNNLPQHTHPLDGDISESGAHTHTWTKGSPAAIQDQTVGDDGPNRDVNSNDLRTEIEESGAHTHSLSGNVGLGGGSASPSPATFTPPKQLGGYLIKIS